MSDNSNIHDEVAGFLNDTPPTSSDDDFDLLLDNFIAKQMEEAQDNINESEELKQQNKEEIVSENDNEYAAGLPTEEKQLFNAYCSFTGAVIACAQAGQIDIPVFGFEAKDIYPRFRPNRIKRLNEDILTGWRILLAAQPVRLSSLPPNPSDEQILNFSEKTTDENLQAALISYVEVLIELDGCEIAYNMRKAKAKKRKIERQIIEEHNQRKERMKKYIAAIEAKNFPIDAERLVGNYFKTARKDPQGAQKIIENNPATFAPIQIDKIPPRFFGMIKPKPEDGIRVNKEIGEFFKKLKE